MEPPLPPEVLPEVPAPELDPPPDVAPESVAVPPLDPVAEVVVLEPLPEDSVVVVPAEVGPEAVGPEVPGSVSVELEVLPPVPPSSPPQAPPATSHSVEKSAHRRIASFAPDPTVASGRGLATRILRTAFVGLAAGGGRRRDPGRPG